MTRARKNTKGRIHFVGLGPGDPDLLTGGARDALAVADVVVVDELDAAAAQALSEIEPLIAQPDPAAVAKVLVAEAKQGHMVVRLVSGDPLAHEETTKEIQAVSRSSVPWRVIAGVAAQTAIPS
ncbi:MAG: SAM-dependent methyltransferase, partial [Antricoccus sp.]